MKAYEKEYLRRARVVAYWLQLAPFMRMVGLNGSLSRGEAKVTSDIDFLVIAKKNRIWTNRTITTLIVELSGYRRQGKKEAGMICLNRYQTDDFLGVLPHNDYHARVFSQLIPLTDIEETYEKYVTKNRWMKKFGYPLKVNLKMISHSRFLSSIRKIGEHMLDGKFGDWLEKKLGTYQKSRILADPRTIAALKGRVRVSDKELCFHPLKSG